MSKSLLFLQFSNVMYERHSCADTYYDTFYRAYTNIGYWKGDDYFEVPKWIAEVSYLVPDWDKELYVVRDLDEAVAYVHEHPADWVLMSLMDCNAEFIEKIVKSCRGTSFILGGYNDDILYRLYFENENVEWARTVKDEAVLFQVPYVYGTDYSLFSGFKCLPRLTLSDGCLNRCAFCIVPHGSVTPRSDEEIAQQIESFKDLRYCLVYIDDKTFGQAPNWRNLAKWRDEIKKSNPDFLGFVVQTTAPVLATHAEEFSTIGVVVAEIGLETYNDGILRKYRKPATTESVRRAIEAAQPAGVCVIANIMCGFPEETSETYAATVAFVDERMRVCDLIGINPAIYTDYSREYSGGEVEFVDDPTGLHRAAFDEVCGVATKNLSVL